MGLRNEKNIAFLKKILRFLNFTENNGLKDIKYILCIVRKWPKKVNF